ncbi:hypothetical protein FDP41_013456 [Naegleria fowleri]|uniref:Uncharacterized protein n=1 Tax=Naegleria fowleri TaxID=5763 RepID=A0A6A5C0C2_NAEFO|nr:uncharacterized protein FDP41_013456 [Naegleria fowleri]KAF0980242.1 hypothetical protein FDP41_013456 [Naegleria fowleri]
MHQQVVASYSSSREEANEHSARASSQTPSREGDTRGVTSSTKDPVDLSSNSEVNRNPQRRTFTETTAVEMESSPADVYHDSSEQTHSSAALDEDDDEFTSTSLSSNNMNNSEKYINDLIMDEEEWRKQLDDIQKDLSSSKQHDETKGSEIAGVSSPVYMDHHNDLSPKNEYLTEVQNLLVKIKHEREKTSPLRDRHPHFKPPSEVTSSTGILTKIMRKNLDDDLENVIEESTRLLREELPMFSYELKSPKTLAFSELVVKSQREKRRKSPSSYSIRHTPTLSKPVNDFPFHLLEYSNYDVSRGIFKDSNYRRYHFSSSHEDEDGDDLSTKFFPHLNETIQKATPSSKRRLKSNVVLTKNTITTPDKREYYANSTEILPSNLSSKHIYEMEDDNSPNNINNITPKTLSSDIAKEVSSPNIKHSPTIPVLASKPTNGEVASSSLMEKVDQAEEQSDKEANRSETQQVITMSQVTGAEPSIQITTFNDEQLLDSGKSIQEDSLRTNIETPPQALPDILRGEDHNNSILASNTLETPSNLLSQKPEEIREIATGLEHVPHVEIMSLETVNEAHGLNNEICHSPNDATHEITPSHNNTHPHEHGNQHIRELLIVSTPVIDIEPSLTSHHEADLSTDHVDEATSTDDNIELTPTFHTKKCEDKGTSPDNFSEYPVNSDHDDDVNSSEKVHPGNEDETHIIGLEVDENHEIDEEEILNSSHDYIYDISSLSGIKLENFHNLEFLEPEGDSPIHHQVEQPKEQTTAWRDKTRNEDHLDDEQDRIPSCSNHYNHPSEKYREINSSTPSGYERNYSPSIKNEVIKSTITKKESAPKDLDTIGFQDIIRSLNESQQSILNISHSREKSSASSYTDNNTMHSATPNKTDSSVPTLLMDDTEMLLSPIFHESNHSPTLTNKYNTTTPPRHTSSVNRSSNSSPNHDNMSTNSISPKRRSSITKKSTSTSDNKVIPYSDVRHLQKQTYNHSTIGWYLNLCSDKYSRTPQPSEKSVKWV